MTVKLEDTIYLHFGTSSPTTGAATNADTTPTVTIEEDGAAMAYNPTPANVAVGLYRVAVVASAANGFEAGRRYSVYAVAAVGGITGRDGIAEFEVVARGLDDLAPEAGGNIAAIMGKTNNLPTDPADESLLETAIATRAAPGDAMALTSAYEAAKTAAAPGAQMALTGAEETAIATAVLTQDITSLQGAALPSLVTVILDHLSRSLRLSGLVKVFRLDGVTAHHQHTIAVDKNLEPVTEIGVGT